MAQHQQRSKKDIIFLSKSLFFLIRERKSKHHKAFPSSLKHLTLKIEEGIIFYEAKYSKGQEFLKKC